MKRLVARCVLPFLVLATALTGISCKKDAGANANEVVIGHYASMTGNEANFGVSTDNGIKLAVKERNAKGGIKGKQIKLITYDDAGKTQEVVTSVNRLIKQDNVVAIIGEVASSRSIAGGDICQKMGVPMISPSSTNPQVTEIGDMVSRVCFIDPFQGYVGAKFATETLKLKKGATLYNRAQAYSTGLNTEFVKAFEKLGGTVTGQQAFNDGDQDYTAQLSAIAEQKPDFIYCPCYYSDITAIAQQARKRGLTVPLIGGDGWVSDKLKNAGNALDNCYFSDHYSHEDKRPEVQEFLKKYQAEFKSIPDSMAALGYDAANLLFDAMDRSPSLSGQDLAKAIAATRGDKAFAGVTGKIDLDDKRNPTKLAVIQKITGGQFNYFATINP